MPRYRDLAGRIFGSADVRVNGDRPWDITVHNSRFFRRVLTDGSIALGESYMDGWWDCDALDEFSTRILSASIDRSIRTWRDCVRIAAAFARNFQSRARAFRIGEAHYDIGNDLYAAMLDRRMVYSCGYWKNAETLDAAQEAKLDLVCRKLGFASGQRILDIGCGWGAFAQFAVERYGVTVVGVTVSKEQATLARDRCSGLPIDIRLQDYRDLDERFDRVVSIGMFEHVGWKNYRTFMVVARRCLADDGLFLLHTIGGNRSVRRTDPWIERYIFPNSLIPSAAQITRALEGVFVMEDWHHFGHDYDRTLMAWSRNFEEHWPALQAEYGDRFSRMWRYYLLMCAGTFRARKNQLWQIVLSPHGVPGGYPSIR